VRQQRYPIRARQPVIQPPLNASTRGRTDFDTSEARTGARQDRGGAPRRAEPTRSEGVGGGLRTDMAHRTSPGGCAGRSPRQPPARAAPLPRARGTRRGRPRPPAPSRGIGPQCARSVAATHRLSDRRREAEQQARQPAAALRALPTTPCGRGGALAWAGGSQSKAQRGYQRGPFPHLPPWLSVQRERAPLGGQGGPCHRLRCRRSWGRCRVSTTGEAVSVSTSWGPKPKPTRLAANRRGGYATRTRDKPPSWGSTPRCRSRRPGDGPSGSADNAGGRETRAGSDGST